MLAPTKNKQQRNGWLGFESDKLLRKEQDDPRCAAAAVSGSPAHHPHFNVIITSLVGHFIPAPDQQFQAFSVLPSFHLLATGSPFENTRPTRF